MNLAFSFDQNYITPFYVLLKSIFVHNPQERINFHVGLTNASDKEKEDLTQFIESNGSYIAFYSIEIEQVKSFAPPSERYGLATFYRLLLPAMLPAEVEKIIYLDVDLIVVGKLRDLYDTPLVDKPLAAVSEPVTYTRPDLGLHTIGEYFNAGVLLINMPLWRTQQVAEKTIAFLRDFPEKAEYLDQDALNAVLVNNWLPLDEKFNYTWRSIPQLPTKALKQLLADKVIIHYNTATKPWHRLSTGRLDFLYHQFFDQLGNKHLRRYHPLILTGSNVYKIAKGKLVNFYLDSPTLAKLWRSVKGGSSNK